MVMLCKNDLVIGGTEPQQESFFTELSAFIPLDQPTKLATDTQVSLGHRTLEYYEASNSISMSLRKSFCEKLWQRHQLEDAEPLTNLDSEKLCQDASEQTQCFRCTASRALQKICG